MRPTALLYQKANEPKCSDALGMDTGEELEKNKIGEIPFNWNNQDNQGPLPCKPTPNRNMRMSEEDLSLLHDLLAFHITECGEYLFYRA